jgi:hypothetical protein
MGIAAMILGILSLLAWLILFNVVPVPVTAPIYTIGSSVSVVGLILGIVTLVKFKFNKRVAVTGVVICSLGIIIAFLVLLIELFHEPPADWDHFWSPDSSYIAFTSNRDGNDEIYVMDADGSNQQRLTDNSAIDRQPSWSPDGSRIAFVSNRPDKDEIYVMDTNGSNQQRLTDKPEGDRQPSWSPDGSRIAFVYRWGRIVVIDADGSNRQRLSLPRLHIWDTGYEFLWETE